jgi:hypothetical protein
MLHIYHLSKQLDDASIVFIARFYPFLFHVYFGKRKLNSPETVSKNQKLTREFRPRPTGNYRLVVAARLLNDPKRCAPKVAARDRAVAVKFPRISALAG